jgi:iron complex transport system substrate-binding protein
VVQSDAGTAQLDAPAQRIAALSATHVEMLYAIGAGSQVIAGDLFTNHPPETETLTKIDSFNLNVEAVIDLDPDLVVLSFDPGEAVAAFEAVGIPTLLFVGAASLDDVWLQFGELGKASGHEEEAGAVVTEMLDEIDAIVADVGGVAAGVTYYHETDPFSFYTPNSSSFVGQLYALLGFENIADAAPDEFGTGYPQLSPEYIIEADSDVIFLGAFGETPETVAARDGWATMSAVAEDRVFPVGVDESSRWGPRIVDFLEEVAGIVMTMEVAEG